MFNISEFSSKSITNRAVTLAGMSDKPTLIKNFLFSDDTNVGIACLKKLGFEILYFAESGVLISPPDFEKLNKINFYSQTFELNMGKAGTMARFFPAVILNWTKTFPNSPPIEVLFHAEKQLQSRPILPLFSALKNLGAKIEGEIYPFKISSSNLCGETKINTEQSSQFLSGLLIAGAGSKKNISIKRTGHLPQQDYVAITVDVIKKFNGFVSHSFDFKEFDFSPKNQILFCSSFEVEPDASTLCYFLAYAFLHNFSLTISGIGKNSLQPDILFCHFLEKMGADISLKENEIKIQKRNQTRIKGGFTYDFSLMSDQALTASVLALFADSPIEITGISHIRYHESNRISCLVENFQKFRFNIQEQEDGFKVFPSFSLKNIAGIWNTHNDHRFAMSGVLLSSYNLNIIIENPDCVSKTAPSFFEKIKVLKNYESLM